MLVARECGRLSVCVTTLHGHVPAVFATTPEVQLSRANAHGTCKYRQVIGRAPKVEATSPGQPISPQH